MGFLNPALLALGAAVAIPLILHLFQRHQGPRVVFPALRYLRRAETEHARRIKFRQWLLMMLRVLVLVLFALAAARPFLQSAGAAHQPTAVAIVLDNSMSTSLVVGDRRLLDELKDRAMQTLEAGEAEDLFWLIRAGSPWEPAWAGDAETTARRVRETEPTSAQADLVAAVEHARAVLQAGADGRVTEIHLLSDMQATSFAGTARADSASPSLIVWTARHDARSNVGIGAVEVGGGVAPIAGQRSTVAALIAGDSAADSVNVRMALEGRVIAAATAPVGTSTILPFPARNAGFVRGWVEKDPDALRPDDRRWFATRVGPPPRVAVSAPLGLAENALVVLEQAGRIQRAPLPEAEIAILPAGRGLESIRPNQSVIVIPPDSVLELPALNRRLAAAGIRWSYATSSGAGESRFAPAGPADGTLRTLDQVRLRTVFRLTHAGATADTVLLRLADNEAWAVRGERPEGARFVLLGSPLAPDASTLPTTPALLPLLDRLLGAWVSARTAVTEAVPGVEIALPPEATAVEGPDGMTEPAEGVFRLGGTAGVYRVMAGDSTLALIAVNPPLEESDLRRTDVRRLAEAFPDFALETAESPAEWERRIFHQRVGREVWRWLALLAVLVLAVEMLVAAAGSSSRAAARRPTPDGSTAGGRRPTHATGD